MTLSPRAQRILDRVRDLCEESLQPLLKRTLDDFDEQMFQLADQARNNTDQEVCLAAQREVRRGRSNLAPQFLSLLASGFGTFHLSEDERKAQGQDGQKLSLVDVDDQEEESILGGTESRVEVRSGMPLLELGYRFAALAGTPVIEAQALPVGPHAISQAWQQAILELDLPAVHRQHLHKIFSLHLLREAGQMFIALNTLMAAQGLLPDLHVLMSHRAPGARKGDRKTRKGPPDDGDGDTRTQDPDGPPDAGTAGPGGPRSSMDETNAAFSVLRNLLARRRQALGLHQEVAPPDGPVATSDQLQSALNELQQQPAARLSEDGVPHLRDMKHLREDLHAQLRQSSPDGTAPAFNPQQNDTIELVSMLFDHLGRDMPVDGHAATMMSRLQVPMLRVALSDPEFFSEHNHPARKLMGSVLDTATQWLDGAGEAADPVLAKKLQNVVDRAVHEFDGNIELLDQLRADLDSQLSVLKRRAEISERRHLEAAQGRERLQLARKRASELVTERLQGSDASGLLKTMVEQAWTDVLALSMLRWGERSKAFRHRLEVTERLLRHRTADDDPELREEITQGLGQVGIHGDEAEQIARHVIAPQDESEDTPELTRTELAMRLKQRQRLGNAETAADTAGIDDASTIDPATQEAMERLRQLPFGAWLEFARPGKPVVLRKLAWFSPTTGHCLVTNQRGAREDVGNIGELAAMMAAGTVRIPQGRGESLLDRAWGAILKGLRQFAQTTAEQSA